MFKHKKVSFFGQPRNLQLSDLCTSRKRGGMRSMVVLRCTVGTVMWNGECRLTRPRGAHAEPDRYTRLYRVTSGDLQCGEARLHMRMRSVGTNRGADGRGIRYAWWTQGFFLQLDLEFILLYTLA